MQTRSQVRADLRAYVSRSGMTFREIGDQAGFSKQTMMQFVSFAKFGTSIENGETAQKLAEWLAANPVPLPDFPGKIYETAGTRAMRALIEEAREAVWGTLYAPYGAQKTFLFETVFAESAREANPWFSLVEATERMSPRQLMAEINRAIGAGYAVQTQGLRDSILRELRKRTTPIVVVIDEAQLLYPMIDTLECLRRLGDLSRGKMGVIVAGNEQVLKLFEARRSTSMGQWRSRVEQRHLRVWGPTEAEGRQIAQAECGGKLTERHFEKLIPPTMDNDPIPGADGKTARYVNLRRMFNALRDYRKALARPVN